MQAISESGRRPSCLLHLRARLVADDALEVAHHRGIRMRARDRADAVERVVHVGHPVAQRLVHRVLQRARAGHHRPHLRAERLHAHHVRPLPVDIDRAHVDDAFEPELRAQRRGRDAVHAGAGLGDHARLAHALGQQDLAEHIVHLVRAGVVAVLALEIDLRAAEMRGEPLGEIERRRAADIVAQIAVHLLAERRIVLRLVVGLLQIEDQRHQGLGDEAAAIEAEMPALVRAGAEGIGLLNVHAGTLADRAARMKARIFSASFTPGALSTPEDTSTPPRARDAQRFRDIAGIEPARKHERN